MMAELAWASWETVIHRTLLMTRNACSSAEYYRMFEEKTVATLETGELLFSPNITTITAFLIPWHSRATANAARLRGK